MECKVLTINFDINAVQLFNWNIFNICQATEKSIKKAEKQTDEYWLKKYQKSIKKVSKKAEKQTDEFVGKRLLNRFKPRWGIAIWRVT